jgi:phage gp29-like protein
LPKQGETVLAPPAARKTFSPGGQLPPISAKMRPRADDIPTGRLVVASAGKNAFTPAQEAVEALVDASLTPATAVLAENEQAVLSAVQSAGSYEEAMQNVLNLYPSMNMDDLTRILEAAMLNADLFGGWAARGGVE